jgi:hypothetical protein
MSVIFLQNSLSNTTRYMQNYVPPPLLLFFSAKQPSADPDCQCEDITKRH